MSIAAPTKGDPPYLAWMLRATVLTIFAGVTWLFIRPQEAIPPTNPFVGDPFSACAFPASEFGPRKVAELARVNGVLPMQFDEFSSWSEAKRAGYVDCK